MGEGEGFHKRKVQEEKQPCAAFCCFEFGCVMTRATAPSCDQKMNYPTVRGCVHVAQGWPLCAEVWEK